MWSYLKYTHKMCDLATDVPITVFRVDIDIDCNENCGEIMSSDQAEVTGHINTHNNHPHYTHIQCTPSSPGSSELLVV